ncbi:pirin family protein [Neptunomonas phycophila]|uniref:pirin family protein n=1 Tax=Neptunomonas phycophila TaxID=1572645 RepID=UPI0026E1D9ED|nr:pirin family protein [Neptunomonas phycophila]MDO6785072.1 pirin family protein [Neptunomonas phycophila]
MISVLKSDERGQADFGWLNSRHTFSFGSYYNPEQMGLSHLRVINDDHVKPGYGFDTHGHQDMEIISYVLEGRIKHKDTLGHTEYLSAGEVQVMSAGTGIKHSEYNASASEALHFLQIWVIPRQSSLTPSYQQKDFSAFNGLSLLVSPDGRNGSLSISQDVEIYRLQATDAPIEKVLDTATIGYIHVATGDVLINGERYSAGDGITLTDENKVHMQASDNSEALLFILPTTA